MTRRGHDAIRLIKFSRFKLYRWHFLLKVIFEELSRFLHMTHIVVRRILNLWFEKLLALGVVIHARLTDHWRKLILHGDSWKLRLIWRFDYHSHSLSTWLLVNARSHLTRLLVVESISTHPIDIISIVAQEDIIIVVLHLVFGHQVVEPLLLSFVDIDRNLTAMLALVMLRKPRFKWLIIVILSPVDQLVRELLLRRIWLLVEIISVPLWWWDVLCCLLPLKNLRPRCNIFARLMKFWLLLMSKLLLEWRRIVVVVQLQIHFILLEYRRFEFLFVLGLVYWDWLNRWNHWLPGIVWSSYFFMIFFRILSELLTEFLLAFKISVLWRRIHFRCVVAHLVNLSWPVSLGSRLDSILLGTGLELHLHGHRHVLCHCFCEGFWLQTVPALQKVLIIEFLHFIVRQSLVGVSLSVDLLNLLDILHNLVKILGLKLLVLLEDSRLLYVSQNEGWNFFQVERLVTRKWEYFIRIFFVHYDEYFWVAVLYHLFGLSEQSSFFYVEGFIFLALFFLGIFGIFSATLTDWVAVVFVWHFTIKYG